MHHQFQTSAPANVPAKMMMLLLSAALCSSTAFLSHQSDFSARVCFCSNLQAPLYVAVVDLVLLVCNTLWWAWSYFTFAFSLARSIGHRLRNATVFCLWPSSPFLSRCTPSLLYLFLCLSARCFVAYLFFSSLGGSM